LHRIKRLFDQPPHDAGQLQDLRGACPNGPFDQIEAGLACGSMVLFFSFSRKFASESQIFVKKN
jgi:hypothetical protein